MVHLEKVLSHDGNDGLVFDELKDLFPETLGLRDSAPPVKLNHSNSWRYQISPLSVVRRSRLWSRTLMDYTRPAQVGVQRRNRCCKNKATCLCWRSRTRWLSITSERSFSGLGYASDGSFSPSLVKVSLDEVVADIEAILTSP